MNVRAALIRSMIALIGSDVVWSPWLFDCTGGLCNRTHTERGIDFIQTNERHSDHAAAMGHWWPLAVWVEGMLQLPAPIFPGIPGLCPPQLNDRAGPQRTSRRHTYGAWHRCQPAGRLQRGLAGNDRGEWPSCGGQPPCAGGEPPCGGGEPSGSYRSRPCRRGRSARSGAAGNSGAGGKGESVGGKGAQLDGSTGGLVPGGKVTSNADMQLDRFFIFFYFKTACVTVGAIYSLEWFVCWCFFSSFGVQA